MRTSATRAGLRKKPRFFYALILSLLALPVWANGFEQVEQWQRLGAYELALQELGNVQQPFTASDAGVWERAERLRIELYQSLGQPKAILERHSNQPAGLSPEFQLWLAAEAIEAQIELQDSDAAFELVESAIWSSEGDDVLQVWRALLIQVYAAQQKDEAATVAWRRFSQDNSPGSQPSPIITERYSAARRAYAEVLIRKEQYQEAAGLLADDGSTEGRLLFASSQLLVSGETAPQVYELARSIAESETANAKQRRAAYSLMARAAGRQKQYAKAVDALVEALAMPAPAKAGLFSVDADALWLAYENWGNALGLASGLTSDYENEWAAALNKPDSAAEKVALASVLVLSGRSPQNRDQALDVLIAELHKLERGDEQAVWLLHDSQRLQQGYVDMPDKVARAALRAALFTANVPAIKAFRERHGGVRDPLTDQENGLLDVHARLLLGESAPVSQFLSQGLDNLGAWFPTTQNDLLVLLRDLEAGEYFSLVAQTGEKLAGASSEKDVRLQATEHACRSLMKLGRHEQAARLALNQLSELPDAEQHALPLLAYEALWYSDKKKDAQTVWQRWLNKPESFEKAADLRRRLQVPVSQ